MLLYRPRPWSLLAFGFCGLLLCIDSARAEEKPVGFTADVLPILRESCLGCHQPASQGGEYLMTDFDRLLKGGESGDAAIVASNPDGSSLLRMIIPTDGHAEMPKNGAPLKDIQIDVIRKWIAQGAKNDTPANKHSYSDDHPPQYARPPIVTSLDYSPDGSTLAISGFHEVLIIDAKSKELRRRLIGLSPRIESVRFSSDGKRLAVAAGEPSVGGELQVWDVDAGKLLLSKFVSGDTLFGVNWSPDDKLISFACADKTLRCVKSDSGEQVLYQGAHDDWPRATVFSVSGEHLISAARDMTVKLTEVATQRFIDNITSITPGALRGGVNAVARHPKRDEIFVGGSDGAPKIYRVFRQTARQIGDDANLIRALPAMPGRVFDVAISADAQFLAAVSSLDERGFVRVWKYETAENVPQDVRDIQAKAVADRSPDEKKKLEAFSSIEPTEVGRWEIDAAGYAIDFGPEHTVSVGAGDGRLRTWSFDDSQLKNDVSVVPAGSLQEGNEVVQLQNIRDAYLAKSAEGNQNELPKDATKQVKPVALDQIASIAVEPEKVDLPSWTSYAQLLVTATLQDGSRIDVTRHMRVAKPCDQIVLHGNGLVEPRAVGDGTLQFTVGSHSLSVPVQVMQTTISDIDFVHDVNPVLSRLGCNAGTCHGAQAGRNGFKLSLRGYDPIFDVRALADDLAGRRINVSSPVDSLIASKPLGYAPHAGGVLMHRGDLYSTIIERWIAQGASLGDQSKPNKVAALEVTPQNPVVANAEDSQQIRVIARYQDGSRRDVTREAFIESGNTEVAQVDRFGLATAIRRGEAPLLARYEGNYAATTLTVMGNREGYQWSPVETWSTLDDMVAEKWQRMKIQPSGLCSDSDFIRRVYLDLTGLPPSADQVRAFLDDQTPTREKRDAMIDQLIGSPNFVAHWTNKWADLLQVNSKFLGKEGAASFRQWISDKVAANTPYDQFAREVLTATGSNREHPAASYYKILRTPEDTMENTTHLFLAVRFNCNKCHDHPFEKWTQDQYYETAAYFAQVGLKKDDASGDKLIGGTAVEGAKPLYEEVFDQTTGDVKHQRTGNVVAPKHPFDCDYAKDEKSSRRADLAAWITSADNQYFARSYVNRLWGYMLGAGLIEPLDDIRAGNPASIPAVLDELEREFIASGFNIQHVMKLICKSRVYQLDSGSNQWNADDDRNYSHAIARRLPAEVLYDAVHFVTGTETTIPGVNKGTRAASLPDADAGLPDGFLTNLGRPARESACECERSNDLQLGAVMALVSGPTIGNAISEGNNALHQLVQQTEDNKELVNKLYMRVLNRPASDTEVNLCQEVFQQIPNDHASLEKVLGDKEAWWVTERQKREENRLASLEQTRQKLTARESEIAEARAKLEAERKAKEDAARVAVDNHRNAWKGNIDAWFALKGATPTWDVLAPMALATSNKAELRTQADRSVLASGSKDKGVYYISASPAIRTINTIRLETLTVPGQPGNGPGFPGNGNFVVTEFEVFAGPASDPNAMTKVKLVGAKTDFDQAGFSGMGAIDDKPNDQGGWAVANAGGTEHWAVFALEQPLVLPDGWVIQARIHQFHDAAEHRLAHFRISAANRTGDLQLGLSESLAAVATTPAALRNDAQVKPLEEYYVRTDGTYLGLQAAVFEAAKPLPPDEQVVALKTSISRLEAPLVDDTVLVQLRADFDQSKQQLEKIRVTAAEDITWALINSPAFLFNH